MAIHLDLYVADCGNNRVQLFRSGQLNATTVAANGSMGIVTFQCPSGVVLDADEYLFIVEWNSHRVIRGGPTGFHCILGCSGSVGSASDHLSLPHTMSFDRDGNIFVADQGNHRIQQFILSNNSCGQ